VNDSQNTPTRNLEQWEFGAYVANRDVASLPVIATALSVSEATARRHLDGLVDQGLLEAMNVPGTSRYGSGRGPRIYVVPGQSVTEQDRAEIARGER
jgi:predicted ArsR family transcriptional regulator